MTTTFTLRLESGQRRRLQQKARQLGKTESELVRDILTRALEYQPLGERLGRLKGVLSLSGKTTDGLRRQIRERNWRK